MNLLLNAYEYWRYEQKNSEKVRSHSKIDGIGNS